MKWVRPATLPGRYGFAHLLHRLRQQLEQVGGVAACPIHSRCAGGDEDHHDDPGGDWTWQAPAFEACYQRGQRVTKEYADCERDEESLSRADSRENDNETDYGECLALKIRQRRRNGRARLLDLAFSRSNRRAGLQCCVGPNQSHDCLPCMRLVWLAASSRSRAPRACDPAAGAPEGEARRPAAWNGHPASQGSLISLVLLRFLRDFAAGMRNVAARALD